MYSFVRSVLLMSVLAMVLGGCGIKGPLYLPGDKPHTQEKTASH